MMSASFQRAMCSLASWLKAYAEPVPDARSGERGERGERGELDAALRVARARRRVAVESVNSSAGADC